MTTIVGSPAWFKANLSASAYHTLLSTYQANGWFPSAPPTPPTPTPSASGTTMPPANQIIDASGNTWTEAPPGSAATQLVLYYNNAVYLQDAANAWWQWSGTVWSPVAGDPRPVA